ncbi:MAG: hypothetical protein AseanaTS_20500 [Candidatus Pelagadaptatus aseana]|uniref:ATP-binding protein n=1 Tax=Candidatus Pelagadaptatus aseana TaxID=3120508 RepID=UPI0039B13294
MSDNNKTESVKDVQKGAERERALSRWIIILLLLASTVMIAQGVYNLSNLKKVDASIGSVYQTARKLDSLASDIAKPIADIRLLSKQLVLSPDEAMARETEAELEKAINAVASSLEKLQDKNGSINGIGQKQVEFEQIIQAWDEYLAALAVTKKYQQEGIRVAAFLSVTKQEKVVYEKLQATISDYSRVLLEQSSRVYDDANEQSELTYLTLIITVIVEVLVLKFILYFVWRMFRAFIRSAQVHEEALENERKLLQDTLNTSPVGVGITVDSKLDYVNDKLVNMLGVDLGDDINNSWADLSRRSQLMAEFKDKDVVTDFEMQLLDKDGKPIDILSTFYLIDYRSKPGILGWIIDVTNLKEVERQSITARQLAEEATRAKSDFLANMSHEIRTPMNAIIGLSELAMDTGLSPKQHNYISKVHRSAESLLGIINDILDFSKIEAGRLNVESVEFRLEYILDNLGNLLGFKSEEKNLELIFDLPADLPPALIGDPLRLSQILINLGNNAIKFTEQGEVIIRVKVLKQEYDLIELMFEVSDTGIGISEKQLQGLFKSFTQADASTTRKFGGTGLGLAISKSLTELMGGQIECESEQGIGSLFRFNLTFGISGSIIERPSIEQVSNTKILVVDDNSNSREIIGGMIDRLGLQVEQTSSGNRALKLIE